ncbi:hypothetical protein C8J57DRAFT_1246568 [Mycena rebaudengoi]|nr:hypothetical protein C8J57DRAFT_1246568 [Mycena rebaudengoi]
MSDIWVIEPPKHMVWLRAGITDAVGFPPSPPPNPKSGLNAPFSVVFVWRSRKESIREVRPPFGRTEGSCPNYSQYPWILPHAPENGIWLAHASRGYRRDIPRSSAKSGRPLPMPSLRWRPSLAFSALIVSQTALVRPRLKPALVARPHRAVTDKSTSVVVLRLECPSLAVLDRDPLSVLWPHNFECGLLSFPPSLPSCARPLIVVSAKLMQSWRGGWKMDGGFLDLWAYSFICAQEDTRLSLNPKKLGSNFGTVQYFRPAPFCVVNDDFTVVTLWAPDHRTWRFRLIGHVILCLAPLQPMMGFLMDSRTDLGLIKGNKPLADMKIFVLGKAKSSAGIRDHGISCCKHLSSVLLHSEAASRAQAVGAAIIVQLGMSEWHPLL